MRIISQIRRRGGVAIVIAGLSAIVGFDWQRLKKTLAGCWLGGWNVS
ncbi:MAG: hypothetical protein ACK5OC_09120 [Pirellula sp.]|jgi:hypothetical protein